MKILIDMNLSPDWVPALRKQGWNSIHWSEVGDPRAPDVEIMLWAPANGYVVFTHDLDFSSILAATQAQGPSVIQVRAQDILPASLEAVVVAALRQFEKELEAGALVSVDEARSRVRVLPIISRE